MKWPTRCAERIRSGKYDVVILNFANCDMVGHTGVFDAAVKAVEAVDACVETVWEAVLRHGRLHVPDRRPRQRGQDGRIRTARPFTAHTTNPVPFLVGGRAAT